MGKFVLKNAQVQINSIDLSDHVSKVTVDMKQDTVDVTSMGAAYKTYLLGLGDATIAVDFFQDFSAAEVDVTLQPLFVSGTAFPINVIPVNTAIAAVSASNPRYAGTFIMPEYQPLDGQVGAASMLSVTFQNASQLGIVKQTV